MFGKWSGSWNVTHSLDPAQHLGVSIEKSSTEREGVEGKVEMRGTVRSISLHATIFSTAAANLCLDMSNCHLCAFYISIEVNHELAYPSVLPRSGCCWKTFFSARTLQFVVCMILMWTLSSNLISFPLDSFALGHQVLNVAEFYRDVFSVFKMNKMSPLKPKSIWGPSCQNKHTMTCELLTWCTKMPF